MCVIYFDCTVSPQPGSSLVLYDDTAIKLYSVVLVIEIFYVVFQGVILFGAIRVAVLTFCIEKQYLSILHTDDVV